MLSRFVLLICLLSIQLIPATAKTLSHQEALNAVMPPAGKIWHGTYVGKMVPHPKYGEVEVAPIRGITAYERAVNHKVGWITFNDDWFQTRHFPSKRTHAIRAHGAIPYVRLMMRSDPFQDHKEPLFTTRAIAAGKFDQDLQKWMRGAAKFGSPLLVEYGTEVNGDWFPWNGKWAGYRKGATLFAKAYRRIIRIARKNGASNIVWVFHVNHLDGPQKTWNRMENYYPGDRFIDWLGISIYSTMNPYESYKVPFRHVGKTIARLEKMAPEKPIILSEFGTDIRNPYEPAGPWARGALRDLINNRWPKIIGFNWWNERWPNGNNPKRATDLRVKASPALRRIFNRQLASPRIAP